MLPVNFVLDGETMVFRTASGSKLASAEDSTVVAFEADNYEVQEDHYVAIITDGKGVFATGTRIPVPNGKMKWDEGNPTGHGIIFIGTQGQVFCYIAPGGV